MTKSQSSNSSAPLTEISEILTGLGQRLHTVSGGAATAAVAQAAVHHVADARWASVVMHRPGRVRTLVATAPTAQEAEALQQELGSGPSIDAGTDGNAYRCGNLAHSRRWPDFGARVRDRLGVTSLLTYRVPLPEDPETTVRFTLYSDAPDAFEDHATWLGGILASHCVLTVNAHLHHQHLQNVERALATNREIGAATGVLMAHHSLTHQQALDLLRATSQNTTRKLAEIAADVVHTGELPLSPTPPGTLSQPTPNTSP